MNESNLVYIYIQFGLRVLSARVVLLISLALTFALFAWAMALPTYERITAATIFAILVFLPATRIDAGMQKTRAVLTPKENLE